MRHSVLFTAVSDDLPCGPDLDEVGDDEFLNYTLSVDDRFPVRYYDIDTGAPFDRGTMDLRAEVATVAALLEKSRDLRLLGIEARFQALAGQIGGFSECVQAIAGLLTRYWDEVHPQAYDGDLTLRQNTVSALASRATVIFPLQNASILRDRRHGVVTYRHQMVVAGEVQPFPTARLLSGGDIADALGNTDNLGAVSACHADLLAAIDAVRQIGEIFTARAGFDYAPDLDELGHALGRIAGLIETHVPALAPDKPMSLPNGHDLAADGDLPGQDDAGLTESAAAPAIAIPSQGAAKAALSAAERYFAKHETSSPALILIAQARQLIGRPFVEALQTLVSDQADRAVIRIDGDSGFQLDMSRMRHVTESLGGDEAVVVAAEPAFAFSAATRAEAIALLLGVEGFLKVSEPSSPVPLLLEKARGFQNQDFRSILKSLIAR